MSRKIIIDDNAVSKIVSELPEEILGSTKNLKYLQELFPNKLNFSIKEAAEILSLSCDFLRKQIPAGRVKANKYGGKYLINIYEINRLLIKGIKL